MHYASYNSKIHDVVYKTSNQHLKLYAWFMWDKNITYPKK